MFQCTLRESANRLSRRLHPHAVKYEKACRVRANDDKPTYPPTLLRPETLPFGDTFTPEDSVDDMGTLYELTYTSKSPKVFTMPRWQAHKSTSRYWRHLSGIFTSRTARALAQPLACIACTSTALCSYQQLVLDHHLPAWFYPLATTGFPFEQTSLALSLLLVFRTDSSYARWVEALRLWSDMRTICTGLVQDASAWIDDKRLKQLIVDWITAYLRCLEATVKLGPGIQETLDTVLGPDSLQRLVLVKKSRQPSFCLMVLTEAVQKARLSESRESAILEYIASMNSMISSCERLIRFPVPLSYTRHTSRFLLLWLALLPLALWNDLGWLSIGANVLMGYLLLGIEEIGVKLEEPFAMLPLAEINAELSANLNFLLEEKSSAENLVKDQLDGLNFHVKSDGTGKSNVSNGTAGSQNSMTSVSKFQAAQGLSSKYNEHD
ncbi:hypothetical protein CEUSTIGMA_g6207.t1 [Chlamydomonas eustigma]|uniref:Uncharacterized protein n=1 Tax=Chlamydomonas eustigma TaxID=1157962 RepID=A0A250X7N2_9CHLO|nr:hypothetical protein CEUSTIGMA_g6207.t1 [Chlamydomonas eustigma]|eukprot:GAX78770.1 hypothetical protein CEUSTIGMA_g6207.t1 [Chlamydomonas eustigma]